jgi:hypothetical protein
MGGGVMDSLGTVSPGQHFPIASLNDKGQCAECRRKPLDCKRPQLHYWCSLCSREYGDGRQIPNFAWAIIDGEAGRSGTLAGANKKWGARRPKEVRAMARAPIRAGGPGWMRAARKRYSILDRSPVRSAMAWG